MQYHLLHWDFPHHITPTQACNKDQLSGLVQALTVEVNPPKTEPKKVLFGPPQGQSSQKMLQVVNGTLRKTPMSRKTKWPQEPNHISAKSDDEEEPQNSTFNVMGQVYGPPTQGCQHQSRGSASLQPKYFKKTHRATPKGGSSPDSHPNPRRSSTAHFSARHHWAEATGSSQGPKPTSM